MASARVVSVLLVCGVVTGRVRDQGAKRLTGPGESTEPLGGHYIRATTSTSYIPYNAPGLLDRRPQENSSSTVSRDEKKKQRPTPQRRLGYNREEMYPLLIPVKFDVNPDLVYPEQRSRSRSNPPDGPRQAPNSHPRLIMDKDFNIRFDNPYIVPVSKPLAFVLDGSVAGRSMVGAPYGNKMMIPFPVLVQARNPLPEEGDYGQYRGPDEYVEHRSNDDDEFFPGESFGRHPPRKLSRNRKPWQNSTSSYKETNGPKSVRTSDDPTEEEGFNESSDGPNVYPSKIFEDMYRSMPKYPVDSQESRERDRPYDDTRRKYSKSKDGSTPPTKEPAKQRQRPRPTSKYAYSRQPVFSATSDLEWVTHINSTASKKPSNSGERDIVHDSDDVTTTTIDPLQPPEADLFHQPTTISPAEVEINKHYWREV